MRILHTSDWHLGRALEGRSRLDEQAAFLDELCSLADSEAIHIVLVAGDVFDSVNPPAAAEELYYDALERLSAGGGRAVVVISGNHDSPERLCAASPLAVTHGIVLHGLPGEAIGPCGAKRSGKVARVDGGGGWVRLAVPGCREQAVLVLLPYPSQARLGVCFEGELDEERMQAEHACRVARFFEERAARFCCDTVNLAASHLFVTGGRESDSERPIQVGGAPAVDASVMPAAAHYVALGHLHRPQELKGARPRTLYSGSPLCYSFSEAGVPKSVAVVEASQGGAVAVRQVPLAAGKPLTAWRAAEGLSQVWRWIEEGRDENAWIDLEVSLDAPLTLQEIRKLRDAREGLVAIRPVFPQVQALERQARAGMPMPELFRRFFRRQNKGAEAPDELVELFMSLAASSDEAEPVEAQGSTP